MKHGYVTEIPYRPSFHVEQAPAMMRLAAALNGFSVPAAGGFEALEIGCGAGLTSAILAAANPDARFIGIDFMAEHVEAGAALAEAGGLSNVQYVEADLADVSPAALGSFDYVSAHGVYTWIAPHLRARMVDLAAACLRPGGLLYVSYNALPGWAAVQPLRRLLLDVAGRATGDLVERARNAVAFAAHLKEHGAAYFTQNPAASAMLEEVLRKDVSYVLHEHFNADSTALGFADVAADMAAADLHFVGQLPLPLNYRDLAVPASVAPMFEGAGDRGWFESLKDYANNAFFRRDVYRKGASPAAPATLDAYLEDGCFGTVSPAADVSRSVRLPHCTMTFSGTIFDGLLDGLGDAPTTVEALSRRPALAAFSRRQILDGVRNLLVSGVAVPMRPVPEVAAPRLNAHLVSSWSPVDGKLSLASPLTGSGFTVDADVAARLAQGDRPPEVTRLRLLSAAG